MHCKLITPNPDNPRLIKDDKFKKLVKSLKEFPEMATVRPVVIDENNVILGGNMRYKAMLEAKWDDIPVTQVKGWTEEQKREFIIKDNVSGGEWDWDLLANSWDVQKLDEWGVDLPKDLIKTEVEEDEAPEVSQDPPASQLGEVYQLGRHRLMCGDSTDPANLFLLYGKEKIDMVLTDPPYGMDLDTDYSKMPGTSTKYSKVIGDSEEFDMSKIFTIVDTPVWYIWGADYLYKSIPNFDKGNMIVWAKRQSNEENAVFGSAYELCWTYPKRKKEIWFVRSINQSSERLGEHPTQKPTELSIRALKQNPDAKIVLDLFLGSGSTLIACEQTNRICYGMELDPKYCDVIRKRYAKFIGKEEEWQIITPKL